MKVKLLSFIPPGLTFGAIPTEIMPWALLSIRSLNTNTILFFCTLFAGLFLVSVINYDIQNNLVQSALALLTFMIPPMIFLSMRSLTLSGKEKIAESLEKLFYLSVLVGLIQSLNIFGAYFDWFWQALFPRGSLSSFDHVGDRGAAIFSNEPSRAAYEVSWLFIATMLFVRTKKTRFLVHALYLSLMLFCIKSLMGLLYVAIIYFILLRPLIRVMGAMVLIGLLTFPTPVPQIVIENVPNERVALLLTQLNSSPDLVAQAIYEGSGHRFTSIELNLKAVTDNPFGYGLGNWDEAQLATVRSEGIDVSDHEYYKYKNSGEFLAVRSEGYALNLAVQLGVFFTVLSFYFIFRKTRFFNLSNPWTRVTCGFFALCILGLGAVGHYYHWLVLGLVCSVKQTTLSKESS